MEIKREKCAVKIIIAEEYESKNIEKMYNYEE